MDVTLVENRVTVVLNGITVIENKEIDGLTAMASDADEGKPGSDPDAGGSRREWIFGSSQSLP